MNFKTALVVLSLTVVGITHVHAQQNSNTAPSATATLKVSGMTCSACAKTLESVAKKVAGVTDAAVDFPKSTAAISYDPTKTTPEEIASLLTRRSGMKAEVAKPTGK